MRFDDYNFKSRYKKHPLLSNFSDVLPSNIKDLFKWMEFVLHNSPVAAAGIKKLSEVPVTSFRYSSVGDKAETTITDPNSWKTILEKSLKLKSVLLNISYNTLAYGNCFVTVYTPVDRRCECIKCNGTWSMNHLAKVKMTLKTRDAGSVPIYDEEGRVKKEKDSSKLLKKEAEKDSRIKVTAKCPVCREIKEFKVKDEYIKSHKDMNIIVWDPNSIQMTSNPISGKTDFFYTIPGDIKSRILQNDISIISTFPIPMIEAALSKKIFKFADGHIHHVKREVISGLSTAWGMPALASALPAFMTLMIMRKANETIASDYMVPLRVIYPNDSGSGSDMYNFVSGNDFASKVKTMLDQWKLDPGAVQTAPFAIGVETILGDGKMLNLHQDIEQLEANIANSLGIPIEFIKGGLSYTTQGSSLRLLENQLEKVTASLESTIEFIVSRVASSLGKDPIVVEMVPFRIIDDMQEKAAIMQLALQGTNGVSKATILEMFNLDSVAEKDKIRQDQEDDITNQVKMQRFSQKAASSIEEQAANDAQMNNSSFTALNQQSLMQEAQSYVEQLNMMEDGEKKSNLDEMSKTNYIMYGVVRALLDMGENKQDYAAELQAKNAEKQQAGK